SDTSYSIIHSQIFEPPPLPSTLNSNIAPAVEEVLLKVLSKIPDERYETAGELVAAFQTALAQMPTEFAPSGVPVLPDYTPPGMTRQITKHNAVTQTETPALPNLENAPSSEITAVPPQTSKRRPAVLIGLGILLGMFLCAGLIFLILVRRQNNIAATANDTPQPALIEEGNAPPPQNTPPAPPPEADGPERPLLDDRNMPDIDQLIELQRIRPLDELQKLHEENPDNKTVTMELAAAYMRDGQVEEAREMVRQSFGQVRTPLGFTVIGERLLENRQYEMAELILEESVVRFQEDKYLQQMLMMTYIFNGKSDAEINKYIERLGKTAHEPMTIHIGKAYNAFINDDHRLAFDIGAEALINPDVLFAPDMHFMLGKFHLALGEKDAAQDSFFTALSYELPPWLATHIEAEIVQLDQT
ncbi:MAG: hypothetical protein KC419_10565, partial [Anaerolineales bacterium]|nr:hypothetical protein [Anaerolineales bacterium]